MRDPRNKVPGFDCPSCGSFIEMNMQQFLIKGSITCEKCLSVFSLDRSAAPEFIDRLEARKDDLNKSNNRG